MYNPGAVVHLEGSPDSGYAFSGWSGACSGATDCSVKMDADVSHEHPAPQRIAVDDEYVYFGATENNQNGFLQRVRKTGGMAETMNACGAYCYISSIKADGAWVFFTNLHNADALSIPKAGGTPTVLSARNDSAGAIGGELDANAGVA